jgi:hypothetical protein
VRPIRDRGEVITVEPSAARPRLVTGAGRAGWLATAARTDGSTAIARANPPVKHMPTAPTPGPPHSACAITASARRKLTTGLVRSARMVNSRATHTRSTDLTTAPVVPASPGRPKSEGRYVV